MLLKQIKVVEGATRENIAVTKHRNPCVRGGVDPSQRRDDATESQDARDNPPRQINNEVPAHIDLLLCSCDRPTSGATVISNCGDSLSKDRTSQAIFCHRCHEIKE